MASEDSNSERINIRIPKSQYKLIRKFGETIGLESDSACVRHFLAMGIQATMGSFSSLLAVEQSKGMMEDLKNLILETDGVKAEQMDIVDEVKKTA